MSNIFLIDQDGYNNTLTVNADAVFNNSLTIDGYVIDPSNATMGQVLMYDGYEYKASSLNSDVSWTNVTYQNSYVDFGSGWAPTSYSIDAFGVVRIRGAAKNGTSGAVIFTLPAGFRPEYNYTFSGVVDETIGFIQVHPNGDVFCASGGTTSVNLGAITFIVNS